MNRTLVQFGRPAGRLSFFLISLVLMIALRPAAWALPAKATINDTIYRADGSTARGTLIISWPAFTTADKSAVAAGTMTVPIAANGSVNLQLVPTEGGSPVIAYKVVVKSTDGTTDVEWWSVPNTTSVPISAIRSKVAPPATVVLNNSQLSAKLDRSGDTPVTMAGLRFASKFASVQAAVDDAAQNGAVIVPPDYPGADTYSTTKAAVLDFRKGGIAVNDIVTKGPKIDVRAFGASGSGQYTTASCTAGSKNVTLTHAIDFRNGDGIHLYHCGNPVTLAVPAAPSATVLGTPGTATHTYQIAALTDNGGETAASSPTTVINANASMNFANNVLVSWNAVPGARAYAVYKNGLLMNIIGVPGWAQTWVSSRPYHVNDYVQPNTFNGHFYKVTSAVNTVSMLEDGAAQNTSAGTHVITPKSLAGITAGMQLTVDSPNRASREIVTVTSVSPATFTATFTKTHVHGFAISTQSGTSEPNWCTASACTTTDNGTVYTEQAFTSYDVGQGAWGSSPVRTVAYNAPTSPLADSLISTVTAGAGTTAVTLANAAVTSLSGAKVEHDDTAALQAASTFAHTRMTTEQVYNGAAAAQYAAALYLPFGKYRISAPLTPQTTNIYSDGQAVIEQTIPTKNVLDFNNGYMLTIENLGIFGGWTQIKYTNPNSGGLVTLRNLDQENCWDYALTFQESPTGVNDNHLSTFIKWSNSLVQGCKRMVLSSADQFTAESISVSYNDFNNDSAAQFMNLGGGMHISNFFASPGKQLPGSRWIDNRAGIVIDGNSRFGGEGGGGWPLVFSFADYSFTPGTGTLVSGLTYNGQRVIVRDSNVCVGAGTPDASILNLRDSVPAEFVAQGIGCLTGDPLVRNGGNLDLDSYFVDPSTFQILTPPIFQWHVGANQYYTGVSSSTVPTQLLPYLGRTDLTMNAAPTVGNWAKGQTIFNGNAITSGNFTAWLNVRSGKAAPKWQSNTAYAIGQYVVPATDNGHVYVAAGAGTSGAAAPTWPTSAKATVTDSGVVWVEAGSAALFLNTGYTSCGSGNALCLTDSGNLAKLIVQNGSGLDSSSLELKAGSASIFEVVARDGSAKRIDLLTKTGYDTNITGSTNRLLSFTYGNLDFTNNNTGAHQFKVGSAGTQVCYNASATVCDISGPGAPTGCGTTYASGSTYRRTDGVAGSTFYVCEGGTWTAK